MKAVGFELFGYGLTRQKFSGTSAMIWYKGKYIMRSSNPALTAGRTLPNAFVYTGN